MARVRRSKEEIIAELEAKIAYHKNCIDALQGKRDDAMKPKEPRVRKTSMAQALKRVKESELTPDEILSAIDKAAKAKAKTEAKVQ